MKKFLILIFILASYSSAFSQGRQYLFTNLSKKQGLSNNRVQCFYRDTKGFLWVGTYEGLCRFDGYTFKVYKNNPKDSTSIRDNNVTQIFQDNIGKLWIWNGDYLDIFDPETEVFTHQQNLFNNRIQVPLVSKWVAFYDLKKDIIYANSLSGVYKYVVETDSVFQINFPFYGTAKTITGAAIDNNGFIWIACTQAKLYKLHKDNYSIIDSFSLENYNDNHFKIFIDNQNDLWLYDYNNSYGIFYLKNGSRDFMHLTTDSKKGRINNNSVKGVVQNADGKIWISIDHGGINIIDKTDFSVSNILNNPFNERSICDNTLISIFKDYQDFIWIGSFKRGFGYFHSKLFNFSLYKINLENSKIPAFNDIDNFAEDKKGNIWIGTNGGGLIYFDREKNVFKQYVNEPENPQSLSANVIIGMYSDANDKLWAGTYYGGISIFERDKFYRLKNNPNDPKSISDDRVWDIIKASDGNIWIATLLGGINVINPSTRKVEKIFKWDCDTTIRSNVVFSLFEDKHKTIWFATVDGVRSYNLKTKKFEYYIHDDANPKSLSKNLVYDCYEDSRNLLWVATADGLNLLNRDTKEFRRFKKEDGLPSNLIITITEDDNKNLWFSTSNGLSNLIVTKDKKGEYSFKFKNFDELDGLQGNEFNEKSAFKTSKGELLFGGSNGFNLFHPDDISVQNINSEIVFTDFQVYNRTINSKDFVNDRQILKKSITYTNELELTYKENVFTIEFSSLNFFHPERHKYKYLLENFSSDWLYTDGFNRKATFTNLDPGTYIFKVKATNTDGTWNENEAQLTIHILPPWWKRTIFRILAIIIIISISIFWYYNRFRRLRAQQTELEAKVKERTNQLSEANSLLEERQEEISMQNEELGKHRNQLEQLVDERTIELEKAKVKAEESDKLKSAFLANMSHEIRTPMNAIVGFSSMLGDEDLTVKERKDFIEVINKNCDSLLVLINDILDLSKIEANQVMVYKTSFSVNKILSELENFYKLSNKKNIEIKFENRDNDKHLNIYNDSVRFRQVFTNLLDNAYKYTDEGSISFGYKLFDHEIEFYVNDSGIGIKQEDIGKLFNYFSKIESSNSKLYRGTGLGLAISKRIIELMGGSLHLESEFGKGTSFKFTLPYVASANYAQDTEKHATHKKIQSLDNLTILIAEDEEANYSFIKAALRSSNVNIVWKQNGKDAVDYFNEMPNHDNLLILMDIKMPIMNGIEALKEIRKIDQQVPVIAVTAYAHESEKYEILNNSFNDYIVKPLRPETLFDAIDRIIKHGK